MSEKSSRLNGRIFPLHLTPFENFMLWDESPSHPKTFIVRYELSGNLNRSALRAAVDDALERHPLLMALIQPAKSNRECWVDSGVRNLVINWGGVNDPIELESEFIDLRSELGVRMWVRHNDEKAVITTQFHHCVCDGIGSYQFMGDVFWHYALYSGQPNGEILPETNTRALRGRLRDTYDAACYFDAQGKLRPEWRAGGSLDEMPAVTPLAPCEAPSSTTSPFPGIISHSFDPGEYRQIRLTAQARGQTPNDFLLEILFSTMYRWNVSRGVSSFDALGVLIPMDLREQKHADAPAANYVTTEILRCGESILKSADQASDFIRGEMFRLKHNRRRSQFMGMISSKMELSKDLRAIMTSDDCLATAVFSNTGDPTRRFYCPFPRNRGGITCGDLSLDTIEGVPPLRRNTRLSVSVFTYRRILKICFRCDPQLYSERSTRDLLMHYIGQIRGTVFGEPLRAATAQFSMALAGSIDSWE